MSDKVTRIGPTGRVTIPLNDRAGIEWVEKFTDEKITLLSSAQSIP